MKNKINNYDFLIVGAGLIGSLTALALLNKKFKVIIVDSSNLNFSDNRTLAVNANSRDFLINLGIWSKLKKVEPINKIFIKDNINSETLEFFDQNEPMGSVIYNKEILEIAHKVLFKKKCIFKNFNISLAGLSSNKKIILQKETFTFKKIIFSLGKNFTAFEDINKFTFNSNHTSYVGFFKHVKMHNNFAYEIFTKLGPLAVLPAPQSNKKFSTFIFSSKKKYSKNELENLLKKYFISTHGIIKIHNEIKTFPILPHISQSNHDQHILVGDTLRSIHPVAGQGWNLGIKDIQDLCLVIDQYSLDYSDFNENYYARRNLESISYLLFTSLLNLLYDNQNKPNTLLIKFGFKFLLNFSYLRNIFIKQAMGRVRLI